MYKNIEKFLMCLTTGGLLTMIELVFGSIDYSLIFLFIAMCSDFMTGVMVGVRTKSLSSEVCFGGLLKKLMILVYVILGHHLDVLLHVDYVRIGVCYMYATSEVISIFENGVKLGVPIPEPIRKALELINDSKKSEVE